jgi:hypothetical protein
MRHPSVDKRMNELARLLKRYRPPTSVVHHSTYNFRDASGWFVIPTTGPGSQRWRETTQLLEDGVFQDIDYIAFVEVSPRSKRGKNARGARESS